MLANDTDAFNNVTFNLGDVTGAQTLGQVIPEPSSALLAGLGFAVFFLRRRKI